MMQMILLKQLVRTRTNINLRPSESLHYVICNQLASQLAIAITRGNIASHTNGIKLSFGRFLKFKWTVQKSG